MSEARRVLLLVGSAKRPHSTSEALGTYVLERLRPRGFACETAFLHRAFDGTGRCDALLEAVHRAEVVWLACPLYLDSLPYLVVKAINSRPLAAGGGMVRNVVRALDLAADAVAEGEPVPPEAVALMAKPMMPAWLYTLVGSWGWRRRAAPHGVQRRLGTRPHPGWGIAALPTPPYPAPSRRYIVSRSNG